jgi:hypothetical protein
LYRDLADQYEQLGQVSMRDRFLMLAADAAYLSGQFAEAERLRQRLLQQNRHHMLRPYHSYSEAAAAPDVQTYLHDLRANYPPKVAAQLLESLQGGKESVEQTRPLDFMPQEKKGGIPPTAPLIDPFAAPPSRPNKPAWQPAIPYRVVEDTEKTPAPAPAPLPKPLAQPLPSRSIPLAAPPPSPRKSNEPRPGVIPLVEERLPVKPTPAMTPVTPYEEHTADPTGGWVSLVLFCVLLFTGVAWAAFTLTRPFLSAGG